MSKGVFSKNQLQRYPVYLKYLKLLESQGYRYISSPKVADYLGYSEEQVRKDLQAISDKPGRPKTGRRIKDVIDNLETFLGYRDVTTAVVIGAGPLGGALLKYPNFQEIGLTIVAAFDNDPRKYDQHIGGKSIFPLTRLENLLPRLNAHIAIITVPQDVAQDVTDLAIKSGAKAIWNFAPIHLNVPSGIVVENVNLASSLAVLSHRLNQQLLREEE